MRTLAAISISMVLLLTSDAVAQVCRDSDGDGVSGIIGCGLLDCNDYDPRVRPGAIEVCNGIEDDCDGLLDDGCDAVCESPEARFGDTRVDGSDDKHQFQPAATRISNGFALTWNQPVSGGIECSGEIRAVRVDEHGRVAFGPRVLRAPGSAGRAERESYIAWSGTQFLVAFTDASVADCVTPAEKQVYFQRMDRHLGLVGDPLEVGCGFLPRAAGSVLWTGAHWILVWTQSNGIFATKMTVDGQIPNSCGTLVASSPRAVAAASNGEQVLLAWVQSAPEGPPENGEVFLRRFTVDLVPIDLAPVRVTTDTTPSREVSATWGNGEWGLAWAQDFVFGYHEVAFARVSQMGGMVVPPGIVQVTSGANELGGFNKALPHIRWSGQEYGIFYQENTNRQSSSGDIRLARIAADGAHIGGDALLTPDQNRNALFYSPVWNGVDWTVFWQDADQTRYFVHFGRMGCGCADADLDGFSSCAGGDCDDSRPTVNLTRPELCGNGLDDDCDGLLDCDDVAACAPQGEIPGSIGALIAQPDKSTWTFTSPGNADRYDVLRGALFDLEFEGNARLAACHASDLSAPSFFDASIPAGWEGYYYLVRSQSGIPSACRLGSWGSADDQAIQACP